jgi:hypothetical protein
MRGQMINQRDDLMLAEELPKALTPDVERRKEAGVASSPRRARGTRQRRLRGPTWAYVCGRQNAGDGERDTGYAMAFGELCGEPWRRCDAEEITGVGCIERTFARWREHRSVLLEFSGRGIWALWSPNDADGPISCLCRGPLTSLTVVPWRRCQ